MERIYNFEKAIQFLINSIDEKTGGSRAFYSNLFYPFKGWSAPYPETTGYIIPTLFEASNTTGHKHLTQLAINMADWIVSLQTPDGALPGGLYNPQKNNEKSIFNTAQMIIGLIATYQKTNKSKFIDSALKAAKWLTNNQEDDGTWLKFHYQKEFFPSYYTRVAWPMLQTGIICNDHQIQTAATKTLDFINKKTQRNGLVKDCGFKPNSYSFLHTIAYTIRGFLESYLLTKNEEYYNTAFNLAYKLLRKYEFRKKLGGAYYENFKEISWYRCLTGEAQMVIIWLKLFNINNDVRFVNASSKLLDDLCKTQPLKNTLFLKSGGLKGSHPYYGRYISYRQPNWATKFLIDAMLLEETAYKEIEEKLKL
jgi:uncharacterized protein YyaL (SSP411 family)